MSSTDINFVLDATGSMISFNLVDDVIGAFNAFIEEQRKEPGEAYITLWTFDALERNLPRIVQRYQAVPLSQVEPLTRDGYIGGHGANTPLLDAVGRAMTTYEALPLKADKTIFIINTDGIENHSIEWTYEKLAERIKKHQDEGWAFVFLGSNNSDWQGLRMGSRTVGSSVASSAGTRASYANTSQNVAKMRRSSASAGASGQSMSWNTGEEEPT